MPTCCQICSKMQRRRCSGYSSRETDCRQKCRQSAEVTEKRPFSLSTENRFISRFSRGRWDRNRTCSLRFWSSPRCVHRCSRVSTDAEFSWLLSSSMSSCVRLCRCGLLSELLSTMKHVPVNSPRLPAYSYLKSTNDVVSEMLGHANIAITLDLYSHVLPDMQEQAAAAMEDILTRRGSERTSD